MRMSLALVLAVTLVVFCAIVSWLAPVSSTADSLQEPGMILALLFYPGGIETASDYPALYKAYIIFFEILYNLVIYTFAFYWMLAPLNFLIQHFGPLTGKYRAR